MASARMVTTLLVSSAVCRRSPHRRTTSTISGRTSPASSPSTSQPGTRCPIAADSSSNAAANSSGEISLRSRRAHALVWWSAAFTERMNPWGRPRSAS